MLPRLSGRFGLMAALAATAVTCKNDPTADGSGTPAAIQAALASLNVNIGSSGTVTASVVDVRQSPLEASIAFAICDAAIATAAADTSYHPVPATSARAVVTSVLPGKTCLVASSSGVTPDTVVVNVIKAPPTLVTTTNLPKGQTSFVVGQALNDTARLAGGFGTPTGTVTFTLFDNTADTCTASPRYTQAFTLSGAGPFLLATSPGFTTTASDLLGTWYWRAVYSGDAYNKTITPACKAQTIAVKAATTISNTAYPTSGPGRITMADTAVLGGGTGTTPAPTGTIIFQSFDPSQATCAGTPRFADTVKVATGLGKYGTAGFDADTAGTWHWVASYSGDSINHEQANLCDASGAVVVSSAATTLSTTATPATAAVGDTLKDVATLAGGSGPTGTITFKLYDPTQMTCTGTPRLTVSVTVSANGTYPTVKGFKSNMAGTWRWTAAYSGDAINQASSTACGAELVTVT